MGLSRFVAPGPGAPPVNDREPVISVIIPTHDRRASVCRTLTALAAQSIGPERFEVIVVADGCADDTTSFLRSLTLPFQLRVIEQSSQGQGKARNVGAGLAAGRLLVFLDDDIEPLPGLLAAYHQSHQLRPRHLLLGPAIPVLAEDSSFFSHGLRNWWSDHLQALKQVAHRFSYRDMLSGNFSIPAELFLEAGGFDSEFFGRSGEDYEFGIRLLARGIPFWFAPDAAAYHHDATDLRRSLVRVRMEGRADVLMGFRHPELRGGTGVSSLRAPRSRLIRVLKHLAFHHPGPGDLVARLFQTLLRPLEKLRARRAWRNVHGTIRSYWYSRGVAEELRVSAASATLNDFLDGSVSEPEPPVEIDLTDGVEHSMREVDRLRPRGIRLQLAGMSVGVIPAIPGAEPVRGDHLPAFLAGEAYYRLLMGMSVNRLRSVAGTSPAP